MSIPLNVEIDTRSNIEATVSVPASLKHQHRPVVHSRKGIVQLVFELLLPTIGSAWLSCPDSAQFPRRGFKIELPECPGEGETQLQVSDSLSWTGVRAQCEGSPSLLHDRQLLR